MTKYPLIQTLLGWLMATVALIYSFLAIFNVPDHPDKAAAYALLAILFTLFENQISDGGWWDR